MAGLEDLPGLASDVPFHFPEALAFVGPAAVELAALGEG